MRLQRHLALSLTFSIALAMHATGASAQPPTGAEAADAEGSKDIIVTARKRSESIIDVPVAVTAFTGEQLDASGANSLEAISQLTPQLSIGNSGLQSNGTIALRGVSTGAENPSSDQAVSINVDGVQISKSNVLRSAQQDLAQVEILKGPQALFFGKNSPGGIIVLKTEDPTNELFVQGRVGYEFNANELSGRAIISGPISDSLGARLMVYGSNMSGFLTNVGTGVTDPSVPQQRDFGGRLTLKFEPTDIFRATFKATYSNVDASGPISSSAQKVNCSRVTGSNTSLLNGLECSADNTLAIGVPGAAAAGLDPVFRDGIPYFELQTLLLSLNAELDISDTLTLSSVSGHFDMNQDLFDNFGATSAPIPIPVPGVGVVPQFLFAASSIDFRQYSQELRLTSDFDGPLNFMIGGNVEDTEYSDRVPVNFFLPLGVPTYVVKGSTASAFGQLILKPVEQVEISGGLRYTNETKKIRGDASGIPIPFGPNEATFSDLSPEITLAWRPTSDLNIYGSYRQGFKSGGFNTTGTIFAEVFGGLTDVSFNEETVSGFEIGAKGRFLDNALGINIAAYRFNYNDLQLTTFVPGAALSQIVTNAGRARTQGVEFDANFSPAAIDGLTLSGALAYNEARYREFTGVCYVGQTVAQGCVGGFQNLAGAPLPNAPDLSASASFAYDTDLSSGWSLGLSGTANYSSKFDTILTRNPAGVQNGYWLFNSSIRLKSEDSGIELALIGRNLTDERYLQSTIADPFGTPEVFGSVSRGREILLQVTFTPSKLFGR